ncbi:glucosidase 2 subunit beta isoform X2 [Dermatophagoides pteronyssinus]|uniref:Glucosidase 2 subunit beta n=1 Tax=Dermatophagoides pteronyssinus TaxID=6956 RepID=A0A6P6XUG3_DERPT|nr:glucosidase 2 subunit beta-like isoform X2 [Dermatophagoides pteronyssinus]
MIFDYRKFLFCFIINYSFINGTTEVLRPRGVPLTKKSFYDPGKDFQCLDGSATIPFLLVNDDYCDCDDGSDEPGTSACSNGVFHCSNIGFVEKIIPSSRVNDGICDCCDASDEYNSSIKCENNCLELGEQMRIERERYLELMKQGNEIRQTYIATAKQKIDETKQELETLKSQMNEVESVKNEKFEAKNQVEELEKEALEKHRAKEEELRKQKEEEEMKIREIEETKQASDVFIKLDTDSDGIITLDELKSYQGFDRDNDGSVSDDEAKFFSNGLEQLVLPTFIESSWPMVKPIIDNEPQHEEESDDIEHESESPSIPAESTVSTSVTLEYDESTQKLVDDAKKARDEYNQAEAQYQDIQTKIRELEVVLETDFGPNGEYMALKGSCFELDENEYVYKLCPFDSASQRSKTGGTETNLGRWGKWIGSEQNHYERFIMEGGTQCWNGPARSVIVHISCGDDNQLIRASEPNRCEYSFEFKSPAACVFNQSILESTDNVHEHSEL